MLPIVTSRAVALVPMEIFPAAVAVPIPIVEVPSILIVPLASISNAAESISIATSAALPISIPPVPSNANTVPAPISIPPAVAVTAIASVAVPAVLVVDHF